LALLTLDARPLDLSPRLRLPAIDPRLLDLAPLLDGPALELLRVAPRLGLDGALAAFAFLLGLSLLPIGPVARILFTPAAQLLLRLPFADFAAFVRQLAAAIHFFLAPHRLGNRLLAIVPGDIGTGLVLAMPGVA
jgi:hypothetical protein